MNWYKLQKVAQMINDPQSVGMRYTDLGHRNMFDSIEGINRNFAEKLWHWTEEDGLKVVDAKGELTHRQVFPSKNMHFCYYGRFQNINGKKKISIKKPFYGGESLKPLPPELIFELKEEFGEDAVIYIF
jgi:hypothetical protein